MWCPSCRADVAAELSTDNRRLLCARCQSELGMAASATLPSGPSTRTLETEREARDLLARWSAQSLLDRPAASSASPAATSRVPVADLTAPINLTAPIKPELRFDRPQNTIAAPSSAFLTAMRDSAMALPIDRAVTNSPPAITNSPLIDFSSMNAQTRSTPVDEPLAKSATPEPSSAVQPAIEHHEPAGQQSQSHDYAAPNVRIPHHWTTLLGQLAAFSGVGLLTCGSVLAMWSYFGGPPNYLPMGWIAAAIGQMLLLLGVVVLISNSLDQTTKEVAWRIDHLAEEVHHMGLALDDLELEYRAKQIDLTRGRRDQADHGSTREAA